MAINLSLSSSFSHIKYWTQHIILQRHVVCKAERKMTTHANASWPWCSYKAAALLVYWQYGLLEVRAAYKRRQLHFFIQSLTRCFWKSLSTLLKTLLLGGLLSKHLCDNFLFERALKPQLVFIPLIILMRNFSMSFSKRRCCSSGSKINPGSGINSFFSPLLNSVLGMTNLYLHLGLGAWSIWLLQDHLI